MPVTTIKDLARLLGVSPSTVSRALRDHPDISRDTKERVTALADEMNYHPNLIAQSLQNRRTNTIGVIVPEIRHTFFSSVIGGIEDVAYKAGYIIMVCSSNEDYEREVINTRALASHRVAGVLISLSGTTRNLDHLEMLRQRGIPLVFFDRAADGVTAGRVIVDDFDGAYDAVGRLIDTGRVRIAHLAGPAHISISRERFSAYRKALSDRGLPFDERLVVEGGFSVNDGYEGLKKLWDLDVKPDALFAVNDPVAIGAYRFASEAGIVIPDDLAVIGFANDPISELLNPPLSTVDQPAYEMGRAAAGLMLKQLETSDEAFIPAVEILKTRLVIRASA